jgi:hypothetical protein
MSTLMPSTPVSVFFRMSWQIAADTQVHGLSAPRAFRLNERSNHVKSDFHFRSH